MYALYKLTDYLDTTHGGTLWGPGVTHTAIEDGTMLCTAGLIHAYEHPLLAVLHAPTHLSYHADHLWEAVSEGPLYREGQMKCGVKTLTTVCRIPMPSVTVQQRVRYAIYCVQAIPNRVPIPEWDTWAESWLRLGYISSAMSEAAEIAEEARHVAGARKGKPQFAALAAAMAAEAAEAVWRKREAAEAAAAAAEAAVTVEEELNLIAIAKRALVDEANFLGKQE